jgi:hypothetical protein
MTSLTTTIQEACDLAMADAIADDLIARSVMVRDLTDEELAALPDWVADEPWHTVLFLDENGLIVWEEYPDDHLGY